mmetsp:Transcript_65969/g.121747  ORF Transcript_65969/g.121747 Transcript_65969/m.121747 type:complete len:421 (+) Transcript_65969:74-1336(+)
MSARGTYFCHSEDSALDINSALDIDIRDRLCHHRLHRACILRRHEIRRPTNFELPAKELRAIKDGHDPRHQLCIAELHEAERAPVRKRHLRDGFRALDLAHVQRFADSFDNRHQQRVHVLLVDAASEQVAEVQFMVATCTMIIPIRGEWQEALHPQWSDIEWWLLAVMRWSVAHRPTGLDGPPKELEAGHHHESACEHVIEHLHEGKHSQGRWREANVDDGIVNLRITHMEFWDETEDPSQSIEQNVLAYLTLHQVANVYLPTLFQRYWMLSLHSVDLLCCDTGLHIVAVTFVESMKTLTSQCGPRRAFLSRGWGSLEPPWPLLSLGIIIPAAATLATRRRCLVILVILVGGIISFPQCCIVTGILVTWPHLVRLDALCAQLFTDCICSFKVLVTLRVDPTVKFPLLRLCREEAHTAGVY